MMVATRTVEVEEPPPKRYCRIDSAQDLLNLMNATDGMMGGQHNVTPESPHNPPPPPAIHKPIPHLKRASSSPKRRASENWRHTEEAPPPPPDQLVLDEQVPDPSLNVAPLFSDGNFKSALPNERGRGGLAAAALCLLERLQVASGHVHAVRSGHLVDRWLLNRMPGRTDALLHFVNGILAGMLGLKPFSSWRALARSLGDSRDYLPPRHWRCLELKGGGVNASAKQPWQAYRAVAGHFDRLANDLEFCLLTRQADAEKCIAEGVDKASIAGLKATSIGAPFQVDAPQLSLSAFKGTVKSASQPRTAGGPPAGTHAAATGHRLSRQLQFILKRETLLAKGQGAGASSATAKPFKTRAELAAALQADWNAILAAQNLIM